jgi:hypothetical protein
MEEGNFHFSKKNGEDIKKLSAASTHIYIFNIHHQYSIYTTFSHWRHSPFNHASITMIHYTVIKKIYVLWIAAHTCTGIGIFLSPGDVSPDKQLLGNSNRPMGQKRRKLQPAK